MANSTFARGRNYAKNAEFFDIALQGREDAKGIWHGNLNRSDSRGCGWQNWRDGLTTRCSKCHNPWIVLGNMATSIKLSVNGENAHARLTRFWAMGYWRIAANAVRAQTRK